MKSKLRIITTLAVALIITLVVTTLSFLVIMFSTTGENERSEGLFGAIFFETSPLPDGNVNASMGVDQPWILALLFLFISMVCIATRFCFGRLKAYKKSLQSSHENSSN